MDAFVTDEYQAFLQARAQEGEGFGFRPVWMPDAAFDFQQSMIEWSLWKGRAALFEDCGMGKTLQELAWAENVVRHTNRRVIIFAPLAVVHQTAKEAEKFGMEAYVSRNGSSRSGINIANYETVHLFDPADFIGAVCDESAILKSFDGARRRLITDFMRKMPYRLLCSATPAPNDYTELGTSSEALGYLGYMDMLTRFFKNNQGNSIKPHIQRRKGGAAVMDDGAKWRFKGHAEVPFWQWVCSWARAARKPSDLGFDDGPLILPPLVEQQHMVEHHRAPEGMLFSLPAIGLSEQRDERRQTITDRCEAAATLCADTGQPAVIWCHLNDEGDALERIVRDGVQISGKDSDDAKVEKFDAFISGQTRVLIIKPKIGAWGLNFQHCAHSISFPTHSFEEYYQQVRRFWRFGQTRAVVSDIVTTEGEKNVLANLRRKAAAADKMFAGLIANMNHESGVRRSIEFAMTEQIPTWI